MEKGFCYLKIEDMEANYPFLCAFNRNKAKLKEYEIELQKQVSSLKDGIKKLPEIEREKRRKKIRVLQNNIHTIREYVFYIKRQNMIDKENQKEKDSKIKDTKIGKSLYLKYQEGKDKHFTMSQFNQLANYVISIGDFALLSEIVDEMHDKYFDIETEKDEIYAFMNLVRTSLSKISDKDIKRKTIPMRRELSSFKEQYLLSKTQIITHDYLYDIVLFLIKENKGYNYIQKLFQIKGEFNRDIVNLKDINDRHILVAILELLKESCLLELKNQTHDYTPKENLSKIISLYCNQKLELSTKDKEECYKIYEQLLEFIKNSHYKERPSMLQFLLQLNKKEAQANEMKPTFYPFYGRPSALTKAYTIAFSSKRIQEAYSVTMDDQYITLKIHTLDVDSFVQEDSELDNYFKKKLFDMKDESLEPFLPDNVCFQKEVPRPSVTYKFVLNGKGRLVSSSVYTCMVKLDEIISPLDFTLDKVRNDSKLWPYFYMYYFMRSSGNLFETLKNNGNFYIFKMITNYFNKSGLPCIYRVKEQIDDKEYQRLMNYLVFLFGKISNDEAILMRRVLLEGNNFAYYDMDAYEHNNVIVPLNAISSYPSLLVQRLVKEYLIEDQTLRRRHSNEEWAEMIKEVTQLANQCEEEKRMNLANN